MTPTAVFAPWIVRLPSASTAIRRMPPPPALRSESPPLSIIAIPHNHTAGGTAPSAAPSPCPSSAIPCSLSSPPLCALRGGSLLRLLSLLGVAPSGGPPPLRSRGFSALSSAASHPRPPRPRRLFSPLLSLRPSLLSVPSVLSVVPSPPPRSRRFLSSFALSSSPLSSSSPLCESPRPP